MAEDFDEFVVEAEEGDENEHDGHVNEEGEEAAGDEFEEFAGGVVVFDLEDVAAVGEVGEEDGDDPGDDVGELELKGVGGVEDGEDKAVVGDKADDGSEDADDEVADDFAVFRVERAKSREEAGRGGCHGVGGRFRGGFWG